MAILVFAFLGGGGYGFYELQIKPTQQADPGLADTGATEMGGPAKGKETQVARVDPKTTRKRSGRKGKETQPAVGRVDPGDDSSGTSLVDDILGGKGKLDRVDVDTSGMVGSGDDRMRGARAMDAKELASIGVEAERATVRKYYPELWDPSTDYGSGTSGERDAGAEQIDTNRVNAKMRAQYPKVLRCLGKSSGFRGKKARVVVNFTIYPDGRVSEVSIPTSGVSGTAFRACVVGVIRGVRFPRPKDSSVVVIYPFVFSKN
jgi:outer membrane biosynthesis protein TonB